MSWTWLVFGWLDWATCLLSSLTIVSILSEEAVDIILSKLISFIKNSSSNEPKEKEEEEGKKDTRTTSRTRTRWWDNYKQQKQQKVKETHRVSFRKHAWLRF